MTPLQKSVLPTNFLMVKLIELEHLCRGTANLNFVRNSIIKRLQQKKTAVQKDDESVVKIWIRLFM